MKIQVQILVGVSTLATSVVPSSPPLSGKVAPTTPSTNSVGWTNSSIIVDGLTPAPIGSEQPAHTKEPVDDYEEGIAQDIETETSHSDLLPTEHILVARWSGKF